MSWLDTTQYNPDDICSICLQKYTTTKGVYKTDCGHIFHNDCLIQLCDSKKENITEVPCPICRANIPYTTCMDVWAFKEHALDTSSFNGNEHLLKIYNKPPAGEGKKTKRVKNTKRKGGKNRRTKRIARIYTKNKTFMTRVKNKNLYDKRKN